MLNAALHEAVEYDPTKGGQGYFFHMPHSLSSGMKLTEVSAQLDGSLQACRQQLQSETESFHSDSPEPYKINTLSLQVRRPFTRMGTSLCMIDTDSHGCKPEE